MYVIRNNNPRVETIGSHCRLMPGNNEVSDQAWEEAKRIKLVQHKLKARTADNGRDPAFEEVKKIAGTPDAAIEKMTPAQAIKLIGDTVDLALLAKWQEAEGRAAVLSAIQAQIDKVNAQAK